MNTFKFTTDQDTPIHVPTTARLVSGWMRRRPYPIRVLELTTREVMVELDAPSTAEHNRAVNSLARIVQRQLDKTHSVQSKLTPSYVLPKYMFGDAKARWVDKILSYMDCFEEDSDEYKQNEILLHLIEALSPPTVDPEAKK